MKRVDFVNHAIILASFGTLDPKIRAETTDLLTAEVRKHFPDSEVVQTYTSRFMRKKLAESGIETQTLDDLFAHYAEKNFQRVTVLPVILTPGEEYEEKILAVGDSFVSKSNAMRIQTLTPIFSEEDQATEEDQNYFQTILDCFDFHDDEQIVLIGHGSPHFHNPVFEMLQNLADERGQPISIGVLEEDDYPNFDDVLEHLKKSSSKKIFLAPILISGGSHADEICGDSKDSWKSRLKSAGYEIRTESRGLLKFPAFRKIFIDKLESAKPREMEKVPLFVQMYQ